jgi:glutaredoxin-related protein
MVLNIPLLSSIVIPFHSVGCGFCERAKILLEDLQEKFSFTKENLLGTDLKIKNAVGIALNLGDLTYPQIVIRGRYVGGSDDLRELIDSGEFENLLSMNRHVCDEAHSIEWYAPLLLRSQRPELLTIPGGSPYFSNWYFFQGYMYSNLVRYISMVHTIILALCLMIVPFAETGNSSYQFIQVALSLLLIDILGILLIGPSPFSLSGVLSTYLGWKYKGNSTSSLPYKFVWLIYVISLSPYLFENSITSNASIATMTSTLVNSVVLVVFRF